MLEIIGPLSEKHHVDVIALVNGIGSSPAFSWPEEALAPELRYARGWGLWHDDDLKAFVLWREIPPDGEITVLGTHPSCHGKGMMRALLTQVFNACRYKRWLLEVHEANAPARKLYENMEFYEVGRRPRYYRDGASAILYQRDGEFR